MTTSAAHDALVDRLHRALWEGSDSALDDPAEATDTRIRSLLASSEPMATPDVVASVVRDVRARVDGLGPLHEHSLDDSVTEIMVNGDGSIWVERRGSLEYTGQRLRADASMHLVRRLAAAAGRRIDQTHPAVDVRLPDGSRLHAIIPPLAVDGPNITIRRFAVQPVALEEMASSGACTLLRDAVIAEKTIIVAGGTSSGKTTLLNALGRNISAGSRVVTIEDAAELRLPGDHVVRLETRSASEGIEAVGLRELSRHALRMRPDRIICGEMRGAEALDLIQAMNTGHRGSLSTVHANGVSDALRRIETMMLLADAGLPLHAVREQLASCIDLVVMTRRLDDGRRRVVEVAQVPDRPTESWLLDTLFIDSEDLS